MDLGTLLIAMPTLVTGLALTEILRRRRKAAKSARATAQRRVERGPRPSRDE